MTATTCSAAAYALAFAMHLTSLHQSACAVASSHEW